MTARKIAYKRGRYTNHFVVGDAHDLPGQFPSALRGAAKKSRRRNVPSMPTIDLDEADRGQDEDQDER